MNYSNNYNTFNNSILGEKKNIKMVTNFFNAKNKNIIFDKYSESLNQSIKNDSYPKKKNIYRRKKEDKIDKDLNDEKGKENLIIKSINANNYNKIRLFNTNFSKRLIFNYANLLPISSKKRNYNDMNRLTGNISNLSVRESNILKYKINQHIINNSKYKNNFEKYYSKNLSNEYPNYSIKKDNHHIKRVLSLNQKSKSKKLLKNNIISNIKFKIKNDLVILTKKNNIHINKFNKKNNNLNKNSNRKFYFSEELNNHSHLDSFKYIKNLSNENSYSMNKKKYLNTLNKNNSLKNKTLKKNRNISPIMKENNLIKAMLTKGGGNLINSSYFLKKENKSSLLKRTINKNKNINNLITLNYNNSNLNNTKKRKKNNKNILTKNYTQRKEKFEKIEKSLNSTTSENNNNFNISNGLKDYKKNEEDDDIKKFNFDDYKIITQLGQGTFSKIYLVQDKNKNLFSMKKIILSEEIDVQSIIKEYKLCSKIKHENIVNLLGLYSSKLDKTTYVVYILMEVGKTDWEKEIRYYKEKQLEYSEKDLINIIKQLISALSFLQAKNIVHRDIKPQNIILYKDNKYKLADFGESKQMNNISFSLNNGSLRGTELYMSPLLFNGLRNGQIDVSHNLIKSDVYSLGLCLLYAATLNNKSLYDVRKYIEMKGLKKYIKDILKDKYSKKLIDLIISMLEIHEEKRPDFIELEKIIDKIF